MNAKNMNANHQFRMPRRNFVRGLTALGLWPLAGAPALASEPAGTPAAGPLQEWVAEDDRHFWSWIRQQFCFPPDEAYFNTGTLGACPRPVLDAVLPFTEARAGHERMERSESFGKIVLKF